MPNPIHSQMLIKDMEFFKGIRKLDKDIQYFYLVKKIDFINSFYYEDKEIEYAEGEYVRSQRQEEAFESANNDIMNNHFLEAFYEIYDFVEDYNARKSEILYKEEVDTIMFLLLSIRRKVLLEIDMNAVKNKILDSFSENSEVELEMVHKTIGKSETAQEVKLQGDNININWHDKEYTFNDANLAKGLKDIILSYKEQILEVGAKAESPKVTYTGMSVAFFSGKIDYLPFYQKGIMCEDGIFYNSFEDDIFKLIDTYLSKMS
ncbi:MAG: hypothetical protein IKI57_02775 [Clostridia bacterium]|nr:hypothetical protein [Clostridia bacterium]